MGYRSEVAVAIPKKVYEENRIIAEGFQKEHPDSYKYELLLNPSKIINKEDSYFTVLYWDYLKWYREFEDVKTITDIIENLDESEPYAFLRLGEEAGDIEEIYHEGTKDIGDESVYDQFYYEYAIKFN